MDSPYLPSKEQRPPKKSREERRKGPKPIPSIGLGILVLVGVLVALLWINSAFSPKSAPDANNRYDVIHSCEDAVKQQLKAPSTAKFDNEQASGSGTWRVSGTVDSQNSFGAMLRASFECTVVVKGETATATVETIG